MKFKLCLLSILGVLIFFAAKVNAEVKAGSITVSPSFGYSYFPDKFTPYLYFENDTTYGVSVGYDFSERLGVEASYNIIDTKVVPGGVEQASSGGGGGFPPPPPMSFSSGGLVAFQPPPPPGFGQDTEPEILVPGGTDVTVNQAKIEGLFYFYPWNDKFVPYAAIGIGYFKYKYGDYEPIPPEDETVELIYPTGDKEFNYPVGFGLKYFITDNIAVRADYRFIMPMHKNVDLLTVGVTFQFGGK